MLIFNEGVPGSGKTYDAVITHLLPALKNGRKVFARINGLQPQKIADYLKMSLDDVNGLLRQLSGDEVRQLPAIVERDALVIIDEAHTYYVASREPMPEELEEFFAEHRHLGLDVVLVSQWIKRMHAAVRARIERVYVFQKLSAVGLKGRYTVTQKVTLSPDKYEQVDRQTRKYDSAIFPLYQSVQPGTENTETYSQGSTTAWRKLAVIAIIMIPLCIWALSYVWRFFHGDVELTKQKTVPGVTAERGSHPSALDRTKDAASVMPTAKVKGTDTSGMSAPAAYVFDLATRARPRLSGIMVGQAGIPAGIIEFRDAQGPILDRLTFKQLQAMGLAVSVHSYGVVIQSGTAKIVATNWPIYTPTQAAGGSTTEGNRSALPSASEPARSDARHADTGTASPSAAGPFKAYVPPGPPAPSRSATTVNRAPQS